MILHAFNHFIRGLGFKESNYEYCKTKRECEEAKQLFLEMFTQPAIYYISLNEANQLLDVNTWNNEHKIRKLINNTIVDSPFIYFMKKPFSCTQ